MGLSHLSVRVHLTAISAFHLSEWQDGFLASGFKMVFERFDTTVSTCEASVSSLGLTIDAYGPFKLLAMCPLNLLLWKVAFLVVVTSARKVGEIAVL